jgi:mycothione reductase
MKSFDPIVICFGSWLEISAEAAYQDLSVAVIEEGPFGGTCLNRGCIPSKRLIHCTDVIETIRNAHLFGITAKVDSINWRFIMDRTYKEIDADAAGIEEGNRQDSNISVFKGRGRFVGDKTLEVNGDRLQADKIVITAGTRPWVPSIPGLDTVP